jgi:hypothetical protein
VGCYEHGNEPSGSIEGREFLEWLDILLNSQEELCSMELVRLRISRLQQVSQVLQQSHEGIEGFVHYNLFQCGLLC